MSQTPDPKVDFYKSMNDARLLDARAAVQAGLYINGLAATAVLTFLGSVAPKIEVGHTAHAQAPKAFVWSLGFFAFGVFCGALAAALSYATNHWYAEAFSPFRGANERENTRRAALTAHKWAYVAIAFALKAFLAGVVAAIVGFDGLR